MTTPTPGALLSAARLAEIRERHAVAMRYLSIQRSEMGKWLSDALSDREKLLAHLDALTPRAPVDGEALGRLLAGIMADHLGVDGDPLGYNAGALALYRRGIAAAREEAVEDRTAAREEGHAAGRSEGEAERAEAAKLALFVNAALSDECAALRAIAADPKAHAAEAVAREKALHDLEVEGLAAEIARLTAELAEARVEAEENRRAVVKVAQAGTLDVRAARLDGALEEREACALIAEEEERLLYRQDGEQACARVRRRIRARATEGRQGS